MKTQQVISPGRGTIKLLTAVAFLGLEQSIRFKPREHVLLPKVCFPGWGDPDTHADVGRKDLWTQLTKRKREREKKDGGDRAGKRVWRGGRGIRIEDDDRGSYRGKRSSMKQTKQEQEQVQETTKEKKPLSSQPR